MGREIRRVPKGWEHPTKTEFDPFKRMTVTRFTPMYDEDYETAAARWWLKAVAWQAKDLESDALDDFEKRCCAEGETKWFWEWDGGPPDPDYYRPVWSDDERTCFQIYQTVSEGTPCSPVFENLEQLIAWMCKPIDRIRWPQYNRGEDWQCSQGRSLEQAEAFAKSQHTFSGAFLPGHGFVDGIEANEIMGREDGS